MVFVCRFVYSTFTPTVSTPRGSTPEEQHCLCFGMIKSIDMWTLFLSADLAGYKILGSGWFSLSFPHPVSNINHLSLLGIISLNEEIQGD